MHPCLQLPEILHIVCKSLANPDLFHAALTCRRFTDPALDVLWHDLTSLTPLVHVLPDRIFAINEEGQRMLSTNSAAQVALEDTRRLRAVYAPRIRSLRLNRVSTSDIRPEVLKLLEGLDIGVLTPNLTHLDWYSECLATLTYISLFPFIDMFLAPALKHIGIHLWVHDTTHRDLFSRISTRYSGVEVLKVTWDAWSTHQDAGESLTQSLCKFSNLRHLAIPNLPSDALTHASSLPGLNDLYLGDLGANCAATVTSRARTPFPALAGLVMVSDAMEKLFGVIQRLSPLSTPLRHVSISHTPNSVADVDLAMYHLGLMSKWQTTLSLVHDYCNPDTLTWIDLKDSSYFDPHQIIAKFPKHPDYDDPLETIDITPLLKFKHLKMLELSFAHGLWLTKDILPNIAGAWKAMAYMDLSTNYPPYRHARINHEDLVYLVRDSPNLWGLGLNFDATQIPISPTLLLDKPIRRFLHLKVGNSPIESVGVVTGFLSMHFPRLYKLDTWAADDMSDAIGRDFSSEWTEVENRLQQTILNRRLARKEKAEGRS